MSTVFATTATFVFVYMLGIWALSLAKHDVSIVDVGWGLGFVGIAAVAHVTGGGWEGRQRLVLLLTALWGLRLAVYLLWRNWGEPEDYRYQRMRRHHGRRFPIVSLYSVFGLQGLLLWIVSLPVQVAQAAPEPARLTAFDLLGVALWGAGMFFEAVGDLQLAHFKADPVNRGQVMDRGLWRYTRHPNYFGDCCVWWGLFCVALSTGAAWSAIGPVVMTILLMRVSGVPMLERGMEKRRPGYVEYVRRTNAFFPWRPRRQ